MAWREIRSASGIRWLLTLSSLPLTFLFLLGAFVLANHQSHEDFKSTPALSASEGYLSEEVIPFLGHSNQQMTFKKVRWTLRFPLPPPSKDPAARRFSSTPAFRQGPRSGEALEGAIRVAAPLTYAQEDSVHLPESHFLKLPSFDCIYGEITRNVNPSPPDEHIVRWLRAQAPRLAQRDEGDKSAIPAGLFAFFCGNISLSQVVELIKARHSHDEKAIQLMRTQFRNNKVELRIPRLPHPLHAVQTQQALASGSQPPPTPAAPHIAPLPEGFELDPPATSQLHQPASARGQAPKRPAPETPASTADLFLPPTPANPLHARPTPLLLPIVVLHARQLGHTLHIPIKELLLQPVKAKAQTQGKAKALVPPTPILRAKARRANKARKARRVKKVKTPKATRATKGRKEKGARVLPRVTQNNCFSPSIPPTISCFIGSSISTFHSLLPPFSIRLTAFHLLTATFLLHAHTLPPTAWTQSVIPAHSVLCSF